MITIHLFIAVSLCRILEYVHYLLIGRYTLQRMESDTVSCLLYTCPSVRLQLI